VSSQVVLAGLRATSTRRQGRAAMRQLAVAVVVVATLAGMRPADLRAETFVLKNEGRLEGKLLNPDEKPREKYVVELDTGGRVTLEAGQVKQALSARADLTEYDKIRPTYPDTAEGQWSLADWCREHKLTEQRKTHLKRVIELDPNHVDARKALGYSKYDGKWMTREEYMTAQGYRLYKGNWKLPQEIEKEEQRRKQQSAEQEWCQKILRWRKWLSSDKTAEQGRENILAIADPAAIKGLRLGVEEDKFVAARLVCGEALAGLGTDEALLALAHCSLKDPVEEVRLTCLDHLEKHKAGPNLTKFYVDKLHPKDSVTMNRAAVALGRLKDASAVNPLINVLVTKHTISNGNPGQMSMSFPTGGAGGIGMGMGGSKMKIVFAQNHPVHDALTSITGQDFGFDVGSWRAWYNSKKPNADVLDARRN
jgi:hypothetical protein